MKDQTEDLNPKQMRDESTGVSDGCSPKPNLKEFSENHGLTFIVKLPEWEGFWFKAGKNTLVFTKDFQILDTPDLDQFGERNDWIPVNWHSQDANIAQLHEFLKALRVRTDKVYQSILSFLPKNRETALAATNVQTAFMWMGLALGNLGAANPYPKSMDASSPVIEKHTDKSLEAEDGNLSHLDETAIVKTLRAELQLLGEIMAAFSNWPIKKDHSPSGTYPPEMAINKPLTDGKLWLGQHLNNIRLREESEQA